MGTVTPMPLARIRDDHAGRAYPRQLLRGAENVLILFAAGFLGRQDAYWAAAAGCRGTCVDLNAEKLDEMSEMYPEGWSFVYANVYDFAREADGQWDVVSLDPWTQDFQKCADALPLWCPLATRAVVLGTGVRTRVSAPDGWRVSEVRPRTRHDGGVFWTVLEPA